MAKKNVLVTFLILFLTQFTYSQTLAPGFKCGDMNITSLPSTPFGMGLAKPMKTLPTTNTGVFFRVLMVFVEFHDDNEGSSTYWAPGGLPSYSDELFSNSKSLGIDAYEDYKVSDYFNKISRDEFDIIADVYHVELSEIYEEYTTLAQAQTEVFEILDLNYEINWGLYDLWRWNEGNQEYEQFDDGYIDMIYVQYRRVNPFGLPWGGYGTSWVNYETRTGELITDLGINYLGTGITGVDGADMSKSAVIGLFRHEYCHYTLGNHRPYSTIGGGDGENTALGCELGFSPQDLMTVGLANVTTFGISGNSFELDDMTSSGDVLKVPTETSGEFFLVSNRRRIVGDGSGLIYDCNMIGDTAMGIPFKQFHDYSKGLYIYHVTGGDNFQSWADLECADGLWNWQHIGTSTPDWSDEQPLALLDKTGVGYNDDSPLTPYYEHLSTSRLLSRDGHSVISQTSNPGPNWGTKWFAPGKRHTTLHEQGIERLHTNLEEIRCSRDNGGDRWDAWGTGYNEVFSPYSSPNTKDREGNSTGIFIYYKELDGNVATVEVYQADPEDEEEVLEITPPSKPMLYKIEAVDCNGSYSRPKIIWANNKEPDMLRNNEFKKYKIYRAFTNNGSVPVTYQYLDTYDDYTPDDTASYTDRLGGGVNCGIGAPDDDYFRYKVIAIDSYESVSVFSDFVSTNGVWVNPDYPSSNESNLPKTFSLNQNYPNPFNPSTQIKYELPKDVFVTIKIYNAVGQVVSTLVNNEYKSAGYHSTAFDGSALASGIYFYTLVAGLFRDSKKMVLVK